MSYKPIMLLASWNILLELSLWLLLGMLIAGMLHVFLPTDFIKKQFTGPWGVLRAVAIGIPLPLCSCGVIPTGIGLKNDGADDGASIGFLISTPQTGIDSIFVSTSFFGWPFAIFKMASALVMGVLGGLITNFNPKRTETQLPVVATNGECCDSHQEESMSVYGRFSGHSLEIFRSIWVWMAIGILISAAITAYVPEEWMQKVSELGTAPAMLLVLVISVPLYVCATASVPLAAALVAGGFPTSAAIVFLMAGPATNTATIGAIYGRFGIRPVIVYLLVVIGGSLVSGVVFDWLIDSIAVHEKLTESHHGNSIEVVSAIFVLGLFLFCIWEKIKSRQRPLSG